MNGCESHSDLVGGYVLGALDPAEEAAMRRHLEECEDCRREYEALAGIPALLDRIVPADVPPPEPSPALEERVLDRVASERRRAVRPRLVWPPKLAFAGAVAAVVVAIAVALIVRDPAADTAYAWGELRGVPGAGGSFTLQEVPAGTQVDLEVDGLRPRRGRAYELWCVRTDGRWVSGGSFRAAASGEAQARLTAAVMPGEYHIVVITRRAFGERGPEVLRGKLRY